jgi:hypothetical protein
VVIDRKNSMDEKAGPAAGGGGQRFGGKLAAVGAVPSLTPLAIARPGFPQLHARGIPDRSVTA